jgi:hypothetical protein
VTPADFELQPRGPRRFDRWLAKQQFPTRIGVFTVESYIPPTPEVAAAATRLAEYATAYVDDVLDHIYESYQRVSEDRQWMKGCGVPTTLDREGTIKYIRQRVLVVERKKDRPPTGTIFIDPLWDVEHKIHLALEGDRLRVE